MDICLLLLFLFEGLNLVSKCYLVINPIRGKLEVLKLASIASYSRIRRRGVKWPLQRLPLFRLEREAQA